MASDDRRQFKRTNGHGIIHFQVVEAEDRTDKEGVMVDYSQGGMRFSSTVPMRKNTRIYIKLDSEEWGQELTVVCKDPKRSLMEVIGSVMWCLENTDSPGEFEIGARFLDEVEQ